MNIYCGNCSSGLLYIINMNWQTQKLTILPFVNLCNCITKGIFSVHTQCLEYINHIWPDFIPLSTVVFWTTESILTKIRILLTLLVYIPSTVQTSTKSIAQTYTWKGELARDPTSKNYWSCAAISITLSLSPAVYTCITSGVYNHWGV